MIRPIWPRSILLESSIISTDQRRLLSSGPRSHGDLDGTPTRPGNSAALVEQFGKRTVSDSVRRRSGAQRAAVGGQVR